MAMSRISVKRGQRLPYNKVKGFLKGSCGYVMGFINAIIIKRRVGGQACILINRCNLN